MTPNRVCTYCDQPFFAQPQRGRPPAFCSDQCKADARKDSKRWCTVCHKRTTIGEMFNPYTCSEFCYQASSHASLCGQCRKPVEVGHDFCSEACLHAYYPLGLACRLCQATIPLAGTHKRSSVCRSCRSKDSSGQSGALTALIVDMPLPLDSMPYRKGTPWWVIPDVPLSARMQNAVAWYRHYSPVIAEDLQVGLALMIQGPGVYQHVNGAPDLWTMWPWLATYPAPAMTKELLDLGSLYQAAIHNHAVKLEKFRTQTARLYDKVHSAAKFNKADVTRLKGMQATYAELKAQATDPFGICSMGNPTRGGMVKRVLLHEQATADWNKFVKPVPNPDLDNPEHFHPSDAMRYASTTDRLLPTHGGSNGDQDWA